MNSKPSGPKKFTPTTVILIIVLLAAVAGASRFATPPPPGPTEPAKPDLGVSPQQKQAMMERTRKSEERMRAEMAAKVHEERVRPVADPNAIDPDNKFFLQTKPGAEGLKQTEEQVKKQTEAFEAYQRRINAHKNDSASPAGSQRSAVAPVK